MHTHVHMCTDNLPYPARMGLGTRLTSYTSEIMVKSNKGLNIFAQSGVTALAYQLATISENTHSVYIIIVINFI